MKYLVFSLFLLMYTWATNAQDAHYWTEQYGTRSMLLSNSVVGSVDDLGAVYYNPARLALIKNPAFVVSGKVYQLSRIAYEDLTGEDPNATKKSSNFGGAPNLVAGTYRIKGWDKHFFAYAFLSRRKMDFSASGTEDSYGDNIEVFPGKEYLSGTIALQKKFNEEWFGGSWSYLPGHNFSVGLTLFVTTRDQSASEITQLQSYNAAQDVVMYYNYRNYKYTNLGLVGKIGLAYQLENVTAGLTITTPGIHITGKGAFGYERYFTYNVDDNQVYERNIQNDLEVTYKTPFSVAAGVGVPIWKGILHLSGEYYGGLKEYSIMQGATFYGQSTNRELTPSLTDELNPVFNFGVGYSLNINSMVGAYVSFASDNSAAVKKEEQLNDTNSTIVSSSLTSNIYHWGAGFVLNLKRADVTLGVTHAMARFPIERPIDFPGNRNGGLQLDPDGSSHIKWERYRFIVGISIPFLSDVAQKWENKVLGD